MEINSSEKLAGVLLGVMSPNNAERVEAEGALRASFEQHPDNFARMLFQFAKDVSQPQQTRLISMYFVRAFALNENSMTLLSPETVTFIRQEALSLLAGDNPSDFARAATELVAELASSIVETSGSLDAWPELLPFIFSSITDTSLSDEVRRLCFEVLGSLCGDECPFSELGSIANLIASGAAAEGDVSIGALTLMSDLAHSLKTPEQRNQFRPHIRSIIDALESSIKAVSVDTLAARCAHLAETVGDCRSLFGEDAARVAQHICSVALHCVTESSMSSYTIMEALSSILESMPHSFAEDLSSTLAIVDMCLDLLSRGLAMEGWEERVTDTEEASSWGTAAIVVVDRCVCAVESVELMVEIYKRAASRATSDDWKQRYSALTIVHCTAEGFKKFLEFDPSRVSTAVQLCLSLADDPNPRVRWGFLHAIGQLFTDVSYEYGLGVHHEAVLAALLKIMASDPCTKTRHHAFTAMCSISENTVGEASDLELEEVPDIVEFVPKVYDVCLLALSEGAVEIQAKAVEVITTLVRVPSATARLVEMVPTLMPLFNGWMDGFRKLQGSTINLMSAWVRVHGVNEDNAAVVNASLKLALAVNSTEDKAVVAECFRLIGSVGLEAPELVEQLAPQIVGQCVNIIATEMDSKIVGDDDSEPGDDWLPSGVEDNGSLLFYSASDVELHRTAAACITAFAEYEGLEPLAADAFQQLAFAVENYEEEVQQNVIEAMGQLTAHIPEEHSAVVFQTVGDCLMPWLENDVTIVPSIIRHINNHCKPAALAPMLDITVSIAGEIMSFYKKNTADIRRRRGESDMTLDEAELLNSHVEALDVMLMEVQQAIEPLIQAFGAEVLGSFQPLMSPLLGMITPDNNTGARLFAGCVICDIIEFGGSLGANMYKVLINPDYVGGFLADEDLRQLFVFALGISAEKVGGPYFADETRLQMTLGVLSQVINGTPPGCARDNAVSSVGRVLVAADAEGIELPNHEGFKQMFVQNCGLDEDYCELFFVIHNLATLLRSETANLLEIEGARTAILEGLAAGFHLVAAHQDSVDAEGCNPFDPDQERNPNKYPAIDFPVLALLEGVKAEELDEMMEAVLVSLASEEDQEKVAAFFG